MDRILSKLKFFSSLSNSTSGISKKHTIRLTVITALVITSQFSFWQTLPTQPTQSTQQRDVLSADIIITNNKCADCKMYTMKKMMYATSVFSLRMNTFLVRIKTVKVKQFYTALPMLLMKTIQPLGGFFCFIAFHIKNRAAIPKKIL